MHARAANGQGAEHLGGFGDPRACACMHRLQSHGPYVRSESPYIALCQKGESKRQTMGARVSGRPFVRRTNVLLHRTQGARAPVRLVWTSVMADIQLYDRVSDGPGANRDHTQMHACTCSHVSEAPQRSLLRPWPLGSQSCTQNSSFYRQDRGQTAGDRRCISEGGVLHRRESARRESCTARELRLD